MIRVGIDAGDLGSGSERAQATEQLVDALVRVDPSLEVVPLVLSVRARPQIRREPFRHPRVSPKRARLSPRLGGWVWRHATWPPAELFCGAIDVFHGTDLTLPPLLRAAGVMSLDDLRFLDLPDGAPRSLRARAEAVPEALTRAQRTIVPSRAVADEVGARWPELTGKVDVVHPGVREMFLSPGGAMWAPRREALGIRDTYVMFAGKLGVGENLDLLLRGFATANRKWPQLQLVLVGDPGFGWDEIAARHQDLLDSEHVVRCGRIPAEEVAALLRGARGSLHPMRYEGAATAALEAMAAGTPVVASRTETLQELLGPHPRYIRPDDERDLADALLETLEGRDAGSLDAGRARASEFSWERVARETLGVYGQALDAAS